MAVAYHSPRRPAARPKGKIPEALIYEIMDGKPIYHKGYRDVLSGKKTVEEIMGASALQSVIVSHIVIQIGKFLDEDRYFVLTGEPGVHIDYRNNLASEVAIYDQTVLTPAKISTRYADVPPVLAVEVDVSADTSADLTEAGYVLKKTRKLFAFGAEKVIRILTDAQAITIATPDRIETVDWTRDVELTAGHTINIGAYLARRGITVG